MLTPSVGRMPPQGIKDAYNEVLKELEKFNTEQSVSAGHTPSKANEEDGDNETAKFVVSEEDRLGKDLLKVQDSLTKMQEEDANHWRAVASKTIQQQIVLIPSQLPDTIIQAVKDCSIGMTKGGLDGLVAFHFDAKLAGESVTLPQLRCCPLQEKLYTGVVSALLQARAPPTSNPGLAPGEIAL